MYKRKAVSKTSLKVNQAYEGETIEQKVNRIVNNKEPISDGAPLVYTDRSEGVRADMDVRTDRFELAVEAMDKVSKTRLAKREETLGKKAKEGMKKEEKGQETKEKGLSGDGSGGAEGNQGT